MQPVIELTPHAPLTLIGVKTVEVGSSTVGIIASGYSGLELAGTLGGIVGSIVAVIGLALGIAANNAKKRRDSMEDIDNARKEGRESREDEIRTLRADMVFWRAEALRRSGVSDAPLPPSLQQPEPEGGTP